MYQPDPVQSPVRQALVFYEVWIGIELLEAYSINEYS